MTNNPFEYFLPGTIHSYHDNNLFNKFSIPGVLRTTQEHSQTLFKFVVLETNTGNEQNVSPSGRPFYCNNILSA